MDLSVVPLHKYPQYNLPCCKLINDEWKRSETARLHSLEGSCDTLPTSLILLKKKKVIGHLKLSLIPSIKEACFVESVVIDKRMRGQGYGSFLMKKGEEYCKDFLNLETIYISTKGQEQFYSKLGYKECPAISIYGNYTSNSKTVQIVKVECSEVITKAPLPPPMPNMPIRITKTFMKKELKARDDRI